MVETKIGPPKQVDSLTTFARPPPRNLGVMLACHLINMQARIWLWHPSWEMHWDSHLSSVYGARNLVLFYHSGISIFQPCTVEAPMHLLKGEPAADPRHIPAKGITLGQLPQGHLVRALERAAPVGIPHAPPIVAAACNRWRCQSWEQQICCAGMPALLGKMCQMGNINEENA
jgi:hypothetical protein